MKPKLKIIIPAAIAVIAVIVAIIFIKLPEAGTVDANSLMSTAQKYLVEMNYEQAIAEFEKIIELEPNNVEAYLGLAQAYRDSGDVDKAIEVLEKGYELTGDERLLDMLEELTGETVTEETETTVTTVPETETTTEITTTEEIPLMPDLVGMTTAEAVSACSSIGIKYTIQTVENSYVESGIVLGQSVLADSVINDDTAVVIMVSGQRQTVTEAASTMPVTSAVEITTTTAPITTTSSIVSTSDDVEYAYLISTIEKPVREWEAYKYIFEYNDKGQLIKAEQYWEENDTVPTRIFEFQYVENRILQVVSGEEEMNTEYVFDEKTGKHLLGNNSITIASYDDVMNSYNDMAKEQDEDGNILKITFDVFEHDYTYKKIELQDTNENILHVNAMLIYLIEFEY